MKIKDLKQLQTEFLQGAGSGLVARIMGDKLNQFARAVNWSRDKSEPKLAAYWRGWLVGHGCPKNCNRRGFLDWKPGKIGTPCPVCHVHNINREVECDILPLKWATFDAIFQGCRPQDVARITGTPGKTVREIFKALPVLDQPWPEWIQNLPCHQ